MFRHQIFPLLAATAGILLLAGCSQTRLDGGFYQRTDRTDGGFACVYEDLIFLRVKMTESAPSNNGFRDWAGKYSVDDEGIVKLKMDHETARDFRFYFELKKQGKDLQISDFGSNETYYFRHESSQRGGSTGNFQPLQ